jgi:hypothetical protein
VTEGQAFRRVILIAAGDRGVTAELEDDFHRFGVTLHHDGRQVTRVIARAHRYPWVTCLEAPAALAAVEGVAVAHDPTTLFRHADAKSHCTHLFELAALALTQAARGEGARRYEVEVSDPRDEVRIARLYQDGEEVLEWRLLGDLITAPPAYAGRETGTFNSRALAEIEPGLAEHLLILRRAVMTARGRQMDVDLYASAAAMARPAACYYLQPENAARASRIVGSHRNWPDRETLFRSVRSAP